MSEIFIGMGQNSSSTTKITKTSTSFIEKISQHLLYLTSTFLYAKISILNFTVQRKGRRKRNVKG